MTMNTEKRTMYYGKEDVFVYRTFAEPLQVPAIPESSFTGRSNTIFAMDIKVALKGKAFLPSFTEGDNSMIVATDSMKNFILHQAGEFEGATMEAFLQFTAERFLDKYDHIEAVEMSGVQLPFVEALIGESRSGKVFQEKTLEKPTASIEMIREGNSYAVLEQESGIAALHLMKVQGSSFAGYIKDEYTTLPETTDRPLFIYLDIFWKYKQGADAYTAAEQVQELAQRAFHELDSPSIQKLIFDIGCRILQRFPQLEEVSFKSNNRTWETIREEIPAGKGQVFTEPRPPFGFQGFTVLREDLEALDDER